MEKREILQKVDHTILKPEATWAEVRAICDEGFWGSCASLCISPVFVERAAAYVEGSIPICTVVGFPHGSSTTASKAFEAAQAVKEGASEIDMVIHVGMVKEGRWEKVLEDISAVKEACAGQLLKVIVEACLLTQEEKVKLCQLVSQSGAEYIKTSTGFSTGGATIGDVQLFRRELAPHVNIKAAGGIRSFEAAEAFLKVGADRLGSSALVPLAKQGG